MKQYKVSDEKFKEYSEACEVVYNALMKHAEENNKVFYIPEWAYILGLVSNKLLDIQCAAYEEGEANDRTTGFPK